MLLSVADMENTVFLQPLEAPVTNQREADRARTRDHAVQEGSLQSPQRAERAQPLSTAGLQNRFRAAFQQAQEMCRQMQAQQQEPSAAARRATAYGSLPADSNSLNSLNSNSSRMNYVPQVAS
jgi:hypothetical protein